MSSPVSPTKIAHRATFWPIPSPIGQIVFIDPASKEVFAMDGHRRDVEKIIGNLVVSHEKHQIHIGRGFWALAEDPRLQEERVVIKGPYLIKELSE